MAQPLIRVSEPIGPYLTPIPSFEAHANALRTLVREAAQNSWDARNPEAGAPPLFRIDTSVLGEPEATYLRELLGDDDVPGLPEFDAIAAGTPIIVVHDTFTCGLDGDLTRAEDVGGRWWRFIGNYGDRAVADAAGSPTEAAGGGSFGLGKLAYFGAALSRLVVIHSHVQVEGGEIEARFIVYGIGNTITLKNYTGRHWWGRTGHSMGQEIPFPIVGKEADKHAAALGLPRFDADATGTTFGIINAVAPPSREGNAGAPTRGGFIRECILWNLWPKQIDDESRMDIRLFEDGQEIELINASDDEVAKHFVRAYSAALEDDIPAGTKCATVTYNKRKALSIGAAIDAHTFPTEERRAGLIEDAGGPSLPLRHVMLTRDPRLVVVYHPVISESAADEHPIAAAAIPPENAWVTIVNMGQSKVDKVLRRSEPEAHDRWDPKRARLKKPEQSFVANIMRGIEEAVNALHTEPVATRNGTPNIGLGRRLAEHFLSSGRLYPPPATTSTTSDKKPSAKLGGVTTFDRKDGRVVSEHDVNVNFASYGAVALGLVKGIIPTPDTKT
ncbi:MAG: hypothetical protein NTV52_00690 [Acidobacteria bacterium]|nr:hypothetical protein [Acidobacteriota bacterium]